MLDEALKRLDGATRVKATTELQEHQISARPAREMASQADEQQVSTFAGLAQVGAQHHGPRETQTNQTGASGAQPTDPTDNEKDQEPGSRAADDERGPMSAQDASERRPDASPQEFDYGEALAESARQLQLEMAARGPGQLEPALFSANSSARSSIRSPSSVSSGADESDGRAHAHHQGYPCDEPTSRPDSSSDLDELCGQLASDLNLKQLRMSALEDVLVCGRSRHSTEAARRLFDALSRQDQAGTPGPTKQPRGGAGSLSSADSARDDDDDDQSEPGERAEPGAAAPRHHHQDDCGSIKIVRRTGSSASSINFRRTLVCSVSPTSQLASSQSDMSAGGLADESGALYAIEGDEMRQCRAAFRQNRRLIELAQAEACQQQCQTHSGWHESSAHAPNKPDADGAQLASSSLANQAPGQQQQQPSARWALSLNRTASNCSRCQKRLYPVDKMELDFARARLKMHRSCFKCQVCSTLLR